MHPASGGHGLNLQMGGHIIVWFGQTWSLELEQQFNARLARQGQKEVVIIHKLVACDTMDMDVIKAQVSKGTKQEELMQAVKARIKKYIK
jgi:SNF2 family DNA or RNA helicase